MTTFCDCTCQCYHNLSCITGYGSSVNFAFSTCASVDCYMNLIQSSFTISAWIWIWIGSPFDLAITYHYFMLFAHCGFVDDDLVGTQFN
ncbi:hypothetical protein I4U23_025090 [Adineta vaga]|nr:hypothetical protein I4U23_025090 [Adineta vaga]